MNTNIISGLINCFAAIFSLLFVNIRVHSWLKFFPGPGNDHKPQNPLAPEKLKPKMKSELFPLEIQPDPRAFGMGFDLLQNLDGQRQRAAAFGPADLGRGPRLNGGDERFDLGE